MSHETTTGFRLSPLQQRLWSQHKDGALPGVEALVSAERLDCASIQALLNSLVAEHEILRTQFAEVGGLVVQTISANTAPRLEVIELASAGPADAWSRARVVAETQRLGEPRFWSIVFVRTSDRDYLYLRLSPLIGDRYSVWLLARALSEPRAPQSEGPADLDLQYVDIAEWKRALLEQDEGEPGRAFWAAQDVEAVPARSLPCVRPLRPPRRVRFARASGGSVLLGSVAAGTLEGLVLGCWASICARCLGEDVVVIGVVTNTRTEEDTREAIGPMTTSLPVRIAIDPFLSFAAWAAHLADHLATARAWQDVIVPPFCRLLFEWIDERASVDRVVDDVHAAGWRFDELRADAEPCDAKLVCVVRDGTLALHLHYDAGAIDAAEAARLIAVVERLTQHVCRDASTPVSAVDASLAAMAVQCDRRLNDTRSTIVEPELATDLFARQVASTPDAVAIVENDVCVTFATLNERANRLAHFLRTLGVGPDDRVGVLLPRGSSMVASVLAVLKAGGAFVPLDGAPRERLREIVRQSGVRVVLIGHDESERFGELDVELVPLSANRELIERQPCTNPRSATCAEHLAYVLFTSGSTGVPKGVMVPHQGLVNYLTWARTAYDRDGTVGTVLFSPLDFDFTITALFLPLVSGRAVMLASEPPLEFLARTLSEWSTLTFLKLTPAHLRALHQLAPAGFTGPGLAILGGEALTLDDVRAAAFETETDVVNEYGPTEAVVGCCVYRERAGALSHAPASSVPIGRPIWNASLHLVGPSGDLALPGAIGEIVIGGRGLARGYIERPDLTAAAFRPDAHAREPGARAYVTGDLARALPDGQLMFIGRADGQTKLHGFRVELQEIAHAALEVPGVRHCAALIVGEHASDQRLALAIIGDGSAPLDHERVRASLAERLPTFMVPTIVAPVHAIPMTPHGKVDRHALARAIASASDCRTSPARSPSTRAERDLVEIWQEVLKVDGVSVDDNFFSLGGDSIRCIRVLACASMRGYRLSLADILQAPTVAQLAARIGHSQPDPTPSVSRLPFSLIDAEDRARMPPHVEDAYPMTSMQQGMLFHSEWDQHTPAYHDIVGVHLEAPYEREALAESMRGLVAAHPVLRTTFDLHSFVEPLQLVSASVVPPIDEHDLRDVPMAQQEGAIEGWMAEEKERRFEPDVPPYRLVIHRRSASTFQFSLSFHHALLDGWSTATLLIEALQRYSREVGVTTIAPPAPPRSTFGDYVALELAARRSDAARAFWAGYLKDAPPARYGRQHVGNPSMARTGVRRHERQVSPEVYARLHTLTEQLGVPLKCLLLAAHVRVVSALTGQDEVVTGVISSGRVDEEDGERAVGLFLNTLPLRVVVPDRSWTELIAETYEHEARWAPHRRLPIADLVHTTGELFDTAFNYVHYHVFSTLDRLPGVRVLQTYAFEETSFALLANFVQAGAGDRLTLLLDADASRVAPERLGAIADLYESALQSIAQNPRFSAARCHLLSPRDESRLRQWRTRPESATPACVHLQMRAQARRVPDAVAVVDGDLHFSYGTLVQRAARAATWLSSRGAGPERVVALDMPRSLDLLIMSLASLMSGAMYMYVDRSLPDERRRLILEDSQPCLVVTQAPPAGELAALMPLTRWYDEPDLGCYIVYTSGSTGTPKGIVMCHRPVAELVGWQVAAGGEARLRTLQYTTLSFDVSFQEIFATWAAGGTLVLIRADDRDHPRRMWDLIRREAVERLFLPCAAFRQLAAVYGQSKDAGHLELRHVITAGDVLHLTPDLRTFLAAHPQLVLTNQYGPAETHVVTSLTLGGANETWPDLPGIGTQVAGAEVHVLNPHRRSAPIGSVGELFIGGDTLARGYLHRPELTAERFVPDTVGDTPGARLYRTGDLARFAEDGVLEFLGRNDHQVKVLGHRIELEEVEAAIASVADISEVVVRHRIAADGEGQLVAYMVSPLAHDAAIAHVRRHLERTVPHYMIPSRFVLLDAFPRTTSGKVDRPRLRWPSDGADRSQPRIEPADANEAAVLDVWTRALKQEDIGVEDDFFELGGHSLTATRIVLGLRARFQIELPIKAMFELRTVRAMAAQVRSRAPASPVLKRAPSDAPLVLAPQQENWWLNEFLTGDINPNNLAFAFRFRGSLRIHAFEYALAALRRRHDALRTAFLVTPEGTGQPVVRASESSGSGLTITNLGGLPAEERDRVAHAIWSAERSRPFDMTRGEMCRATLVQLGPGDYLAMLTTHHLVCDGWSVDVLTSELSLYYAAAAGGTPPVLPRLPFQYGDFAAWQRDWLESADAARQYAYWRHRLAPPLPDLFPRIIGHEHADVYLSVRASQVFSIGAKALEAARTVARRERCTLFAAFLAALKVAMSTETGQRDVRVGTFAANRGLPGTEGIVGLFTNVVCLRSSVDAHVRFGDFVRAVHHTIAEAMAHQDLPFEVLAHRLEHEIPAARVRLFQVLVLWHDVSPDALQMRDVDAMPHRAERDELTTVLARNALDLKLEFVERASEVNGTATFALTRFTPAEALAFVEAASRHLIQASIDPAIAIGGLREPVPGTGLQGMLSPSDHRGGLS